jgi:AAA15 family ATPase/GTPase
MLRLLAILAELTTNHSLLMFDEIENGINPELIEFLIDELLAARQQLLVTTHSPLVLNYLEDEIALKSVQYLYKTATGFTKSVPFYEIPSIAEKLQVMGPGEVFVDTNLTKLADEITRLMPSGD